MEWISIHTRLVAFWVPMVKYLDYFILVYNNISSRDISDGATDHYLLLRSRFNTIRFLCCVLVWKTRCNDILTILPFNHTVINRCVLFYITFISRVEWNESHPSHFSCRCDAFFNGNRSRILLTYFTLLKVFISMLFKKVVCIWGKSYVNGFFLCGTQEEL